MYYYVINNLAKVWIAFRQNDLKIEKMPMSHISHMRKLTLPSNYLQAWVKLWLYQHVGLKKDF